MSAALPADLRGGRGERTFGLLRELRRRPEMVLALVIVGFLLFTALFPGALTDLSPTDVDVAGALQPPSAAHWFGTDDVGRDVFARVIYGTRVTLSIVAGSLAISAVLGGLAGLVAGYFGRWPDMVAARGVDVILSFPPIILGVVITGVLGTGITNLVMALAIVYLPLFFRIARAGAIAEAGRTYVEAARSLGVPEWQILVRHVLRNVLPLILVQYMILFPLALQIEAALGFLGLGIQPPTPDWGAILEQSKNYLLFAPWMSVFPGLFIVLAASGVILLGRSVQRIVDAA
ncbi:ABC transporter permease [Marinimicrococcus flavescens]|uniref:ABC transporter permease n=1 Tax=Marinimicrococcus flavescens TaxID=3031815 RepID=A0AAP3UXP6_9PROT|nr:ABC transporter permease [Marinimicrococcus flavescens]